MAERRERVPKSVAILLGGDGPEGEPEGDEMSAEDTPSEEFIAALEVALPDVAADPERTDALWAALREAML